ncbi:MAG: energy-coupling factor transporter transmembrane protein EcfT [Gemmatimonadota bacterium]|nr:energy-coupling factor transporter transmembrane protein EcfT [Gemmatimonadota bacterium]
MRSSLDRWNPLTPLAASVLLVVLAYVGPQPASAMIALTIAIAVAVASGVGAGVVRLALVVAVPSWIFIFLMDGVFAPAGPRSAAMPAAAIGAFAIVIRLAAAIAALGWIVLGVPPRRLTRALAARGLPGWAAYVIVASLEAVPQAKRRAEEVLDAQRCRGLAVKGGLLGRVRALLPLAGPLVVGLVTESEERALALEARGFRPSRPRTALTPVSDPSDERAVRAVLWIATLSLIAWRLVPWSRFR